ncbi:Hypothetical predicted protein [Xyrichtys novacula]|uniref:Uncharacterized protein n=1 Tax=Xyrichtys novacula TaxID=13765 RepID=A0AAV1GJF9_XYRNO|nr:Hypothetical predicted protein [Xyrichtys novacula]
MARNTVLWRDVGSDEGEPASLLLQPSLKCSPSALSQSCASTPQQSSNARLVRLYAAVQSGRTFFCSTAQRIREREEGRNKTILYTIKR